MSIQLFPHKLSHRELEARLQPGLTVLPGQLLRFEEQSRTYGQITEVWSVEDTANAGQREQMVRVRLLRGMPSMKPAEITFLQPSQMADELAGLMPKPEHPVQLNGFEGEYLRLGALTLLEGTDFVGKYHALLALMRAIRPYQKILVIDPLGVFETVGDVTCYVAGEQVRLGLQQVNGKRFLDVFGAQFPSGVRKPVTEAVAAHWPEAGPFTGFSRLLTSGMITESLLKNLILQNCAEVIHNKVFAEMPNQVLNLAELAKNPVSVLDVSTLQDPWKGYVYQEVLSEIFGNPALGLVPILIYPENYLPNLAHWVQKADEYQVHLLGLVSPYAGPAVFQLANNVVSVKPMGPWTLQGDLTLGLPVQIGGEPEPEIVPVLLPEPVLPKVTASSDYVAPVEAYPPLEELFLENNIPEPDELEAENTVFETGFSNEDGGTGLAGLSALAGRVVVEPSFEPVNAEPKDAEPMFSSWGQEEHFETEIVMPPYVGEVAPSLEEEPEAAGNLQDEGLEGLLSLTSEDSFVEELPLPASLSQSSLYRTPVVDLSSPATEAIPSFLSAEQLSDLLNTSTTPLEVYEPLAEREIVEPNVPEILIQQGPEAEISVLGASGLGDPLDYPDAEEGAMAFGDLNLPETVSSAAAYSEPLPTEDALPVFPAFNEPEALTPELEKFSEEPVSGMSMASTFPLSDEVGLASTPAFPDVDGFESDEFTFELNLDREAPHQGPRPEPVKESAVPKSALPESVARSLSGFEQPEVLPTDPLLDFDTQGVAQQLAHPPEAGRPAANPAVVYDPEPELFELPLAESGHPLWDEAAVAQENLETAHPPSDDADMQEALDLIFPRQFEQSPEPQSSPPVHRSEFVETVTPDEEPVPVIHKKQVPSPEGLPAFKAGDKVRHASYGLGIVQKVIPMDDSVVLNVTFENVGKRLLDPALTQLTLESAG